MQPLPNLRLGPLALRPVEGAGLAPSRPIPLHRREESSRRLEVFGERCSGTNFLETLIDQNLLGVRRIEPVSWKHSYPDRGGLPGDDTIYVVVVRDPYNWLRSFHRSPWHVAPELRHRDFSSFIRAEWKCVWDEQGFVFPGDPRYGAEMMRERDPITRRRFANVLHMRNRKLESYLALREKSSAVMLVRFESLTADPVGFLQRLEARFGLGARRRVRIPVGYKGRMSWKRRLAFAVTFGRVGRFHPKGYPPIGPRDLEFINENIDWDLESACGHGLARSMGEIPVRVPVARPEVFA